MLLLATVFLPIQAQTSEKIQYVESFTLDTQTLTFSDKSGAQHTANLYAGQWVVVNFWATWCTPCVAELPSLSAFQELYKNDIRVLTLAQGRETHAQLAAFLSTLNIRNLPALKDDKSAAFRAAKARGLPTSLVINPAGKLVARIEGEIDWMDPAVRKRFEEWVKPQSPPA